MPPGPTRSPPSRSTPAPTRSPSPAPVGYAPGDWDCDAGTLTGASLVLTPGVDATCTIVNDDIPATLTLVKTVTNDNGGTAVPADWNLTADGPTTGSPVPPGPTAVTAVPVSAGSYVLSESGPDGYAASDWTCVGGSLTGSTVTLELGESATCTIDNDDNAPSLTLVKTVSNDDGGTALPTEWTLTATGPTPGITGPTGDTAVTAVPVTPGAYDLSEAGGPDGYAASDWTCVGGSLTGSTVTLELGESATCTIDNDDQPASLTLVKTVTNDNGGTAEPEEWTLTAAGPTTGVTGATGSDAVTAVPVDAGTYTLSESGGRPGYTAGAWDCDAGTLTGASLVLTPASAPPARSTTTTCNRCSPWSRPSTTTTVPAPPRTPPGPWRPPDPHRSSAPPAPPR